MRNRVYFFANIGNKNNLLNGGGEVGNRRTLKLLQNCGFEVKAIEKYSRVENHSLINVFRLSFRIILCILKYLGILIRGRRKRSIVHVVGFYGSMVYFEMLLVCIAKTLRYKIVYEMRGGGAEKWFKNGNVLYKRTFSKILNFADCIFSQGLENIDLINRICNNKKRVLYYPNCVMADFYESTNPDKPHDKINIIYFGRVSKTKNINVVIDVFEILRNKFDNMFLYILGNCPDDNYLKLLHEQLENKGMDKYTMFFPPCDHAKLKVFLKDKHFFIFPTKEPREGHSNALTEAMAWGVIPIATNHGFNRSVINDDSLIVQSLNPEEFANKIEEIIKFRRVDKLSSKMHDRVMSEYTERIVAQKLKTEYEYLFNNFL